LPILCVSLPAGRQGSIHELEEIRKNDEQRQKALEEAGFTVLRFTNNEVLTNIQWVHSYLEEWIEKKIASKE
jgi:very-short-patch-repair endonuclease